MLIFCFLHCDNLADDGRRPTRWAASAAKAVAAAKEKVAESKKAEAASAEAAKRAAKEVASTTSSTNSFAALAGDLTGKSPDSWLVNARKKKNITTVKGTKQSGILEGVAPKPRDYWEIFVSRLKETTTADQVKRHLHENGIEVKDVYLLNSKRIGTKSAKIRVALEHRNRVKEENVWPMHCCVQDWAAPAKAARKSAI